MSRSMPWLPFSTQCLISDIHLSFSSRPIVQACDRQAVALALFDCLLSKKARILSEVVIRGTLKQRPAERTMFAREALDRRLWTKYFIDLAALASERALQCPDGRFARPPHLG